MASFFLKESPIIPSELVQKPVKEKISYKESEYEYSYHDQTQKDIVHSITPPHGIYTIYESIFELLSIPPKQASSFRRSEQSQA